MSEDAQVMYLSVNQLAKRWNVGGQTVRRMIKAGELRAFRLRGLEWRVNLEDVVKYETTGRYMTADKAELERRYEGLPEVEDAEW